MNYILYLINYRSYVYIQNQKKIGYNLYNIRIAL